MRRVREVLPPWTVVVPVVLLLWFSLPTLATLHERYLADDDYSHGYLVLLLTVVLLYLEARRKALPELRASWAGFACVLALLLASLFGYASTAMLIAQAALPLLFASCLWAVGGGDVARRFVLPLGFAYFAIPVWDVFVEPLRQLTILVVTAGMRALNLPAYIEGNLVYVPSGTFEVQGGCAGLRYALVGVTLTVLSSMLNRRPLRDAALLTGSALLLALVGNWLRVFLTVAAGLSPETLVLRLIADYHTAFGWILFVIFMVPVFYLDRRMQLRAAVEPPPVAMEWRRAAGASAAVVASCLVLATAALFSMHIGRADEEPVHEQPVALAAPDVAGWNLAADWADGRRPVFIGATAQASGWYSDGTAQVAAFVVHYARQSQGYEIIHTQMRPEGQVAVVVASREAAAPDETGPAVDFEEIEALDRGGSRRLVWVGYRVAGNTTASRWAAKLHQALGVFRGRRDAQALVLTAECGSDCNGARATLAEFAAAAPTFYDDIAMKVAGL